MKVKIGRDKLTLSRRSGFDALEVGEFVEEKGEDNNMVKYVAMVQIVHDSLKATAKRLPWYRFLSKKKYAKITFDYLQEVLSLAELIAYSNEVLKLDGLLDSAALKKKTAENGENQ